MQEKQFVPAGGWENSNTLEISLATKVVFEKDKEISRLIELTETHLHC